MKTGVIEVKVKIYLEIDLDEEDARELVENMDYNFEHPLISHTEIVEDDIANLEDNDLFECTECGNKLDIKDKVAKELYCEDCAAFLLDN